MRMKPHEIIPGKLYQRAHFFTAPRHLKQKMLDDFSINLVVNLWTRIDHDMEIDGMMYLYWPIPGNKVPEDLNTMVNFIAAQIENGRVALIHCEAGVNRSVFLTICVVAKVLGLTFKDAQAYTLQRIPRVKMRKPLMAFLAGEWQFGQL